MKKKIYSNVEVSCMFQQMEELTKEDCVEGVFSRSEGGFLFEETVKETRRTRNPKLFKGEFCSLVHRKDGKYQIHMNTIDASKISDPGEQAFKVYSELLKAFKMME